MSDLEIFKWIGVACVSVSAMRVAYVFTSCLLGMLLGRFKIFHYYADWVAFISLAPQDTFLQVGDVAAHWRQPIKPGVAAARYTALVRIAVHHQLSQQSSWGSIRRLSSKPCLTRWHSLF